MKSRNSPPPAIVTRWLLSSAALLAGVGLIAFAVHAAGSITEVVENVRAGVPTAPGFIPLVLGILSIIYGAVGLLFRQDDHDH